MSRASDSISQCYVMYHDVHEHEIEEQTDQIPSCKIQVELTIDFDLIHHDPMTDISSIVSSHHTLRLGFNDLRYRLNLLLAPILTRLGINTSSTRTIIREIKSLGVEIASSTLNNRGVYCKALSLHSMIQATDSEMEYETLMMTSAFDESTSEFERSNYGMVAATESSINELLKKLRIQEDEDEEKYCTICLEELEVGFEATRMPCSHTFHGDCIQKWLKKSHYCPVCRYEMPTK